MVKLNQVFEVWFEDKTPVDCKVVEIINDKEAILERRDNGQLIKANWYN